MPESKTKLFPVSARELDCLIAEIRGWKYIKKPKDPRQEEWFIGIDPMHRECTIPFYSSGWLEAGMLFEEILKEKGFVSIWANNEDIKSVQIGMGPEHRITIPAGTRVSFIEGDVGSYAKKTCEAIAKAWLAHKGIEFFEPEDKKEETK